MAAPRGYDLTGGRLPLLIPGTGTGTGTGTGAGTGSGTGTGTATGTSSAQFSSDDNMRALRAQAKQNPDTRVGYRRLFRVLQSFCAEHDHDAQVFSLELAELFCAYMLSRITRRVRFRFRPPTILFHPLAWPRLKVPIGSVKRHYSISTGRLVGTSMVMHVLYTVLCLGALVTCSTPSGCFGGPRGPLPRRPMLSRRSCRYC